MMFWRNFKCECGIRPWSKCERCVGKLNERIPAGMRPRANPVWCVDPGVTYEDMCLEIDRQVAEIRAKQWLHDLWCGNV